MKFRKKPVVVDAVQWFPPGDDRWPGKIEEVECNPLNCPYDSGYFIYTLEGWMRLKPGSWIITGVKGEKYACDEEIFALTYEAVSDQPSAISQSIPGWQLGPPSIS